MSTRRRPRSRGVPAPPRKPHHSLLARLTLMWATMYPVPRMLIAAALFVTIGYGVVALVVLVPAREGYLAYLCGVPVLAGVGLAIFARGEPNDRTAVHWPRMSEAEFNALEDRVERLARDSGSAQSARARHPRKQVMFDPARNEQDFIELVRQAIDDLPPEFAHALDHVGVVVSDQGEVQRINGRRQRLYGQYIGYGSRNFYWISRPVTWALPDHIVIFRDTLVRDYGHDPSRLQTAVTRTLRHELAHHLGWDEEGVRALGL